MTIEEKVEHFIRFPDKTEGTDGCTFTGFRRRSRLSTQTQCQSHEITYQEYFKAMNTAVNFINEHLHETINLRNLAEAVHISGFHFHRIFKAILGECPGRYIRRLRMEKVAFRLTATEQTLVEIAEQTGYQSSQALSKAFRKYYGLAPSEFRKRPQKSMPA
jgi:AraC family transcriptional regulator